MEQQKVFATAWKGFEKKAVLDYIYEQDKLFKRKEAEWEARLAEYETKLETVEETVVEGQFEEQLEALTLSYNEEKENSQNLAARYDALTHELEQLAKMAKAKERELLNQVELNTQLSQKCESLEGKLKVLADHLILERETAVPEPKLEPIVKLVEMEPEKEYASVKEELDDFRQSVSKTLLNFEAALARLETERGDAEPRGPEANFFQ